MHKSVMRRLSAASAPLSLFLLNAYLCRELFTVEYTHQMGSIEAAYISISRLILRNWGDLSWFPEWYGGIPQQNSYPPLLHLIVAAVASVARISPALSHHMVTASCYSIGPVTLYLLALRLSGSRATSFVAGVIYSLEAPSAFLSREVRADVGGLFHPRRLQALVMYGEGPHITSMALLPLALIALDRALDSRKPFDILLAALALAAVALTNWLGAFALAGGVFCLILARTENIGRVLCRPFGIAGAIGLLAYLLASPWLPPSTIRTIRYNAQFIGGDYRHLYQVLPLYVAIAVLCAFAIKYALNSIGAPKAFQFFFLLSAFTSLVALSSYWENISLLPQPKRYHLEMDLALCGLAVFAARWALARAPRWTTGVALVLTLCFLAPQIHRYRRYSRDLIQPLDIRTTNEYKVAKWFETHSREGRVFLPGIASYWLNAFTDTPQFGGGFDQGQPYPVFGIPKYLFYAGEGHDPAGATELWLRAYGVTAIDVGAPEIAEEFKPFQRVERFRTLPVLWSEGGYAVHEIPARSPSLAHVVEEDEWVRHPPEGAYDQKELRPFVQALQNADRPLAELQWTSRHSARIKADLRPTQLISVQENWHPGWHASVNGESRLVIPDGLGFIVIEPRCNGHCTIDLFYDGGLEMQLAKLASAASLLACLVWIVADRARALPQRRVLPKCKSR